MHEPFHEGEIAVQTQTGVRHMASRVGNGIHAAIPEAAQDFLRDQLFVVVGFADKTTTVWASFLWGQAGFMRAETNTTVRIDALPHPTDPFFAALRNAGESGLAVGLLAIEPATRRRMRLNGRAFLEDDGLFVHAGEVYANCPKYIQKRDQAAFDAVSGRMKAVSTLSSALSDAQQKWIANTDTFFIASAHPARETADASHWGGNPGFVHVESDGRVLTWPDYSGNAMFNTLGNLAVHPQAGLLLADFTTGRTLQITGQTEILWDAQQIALFPGAERAVSLSVKAVRETNAAFPLRSHLLEYSRFNPPI